MSGERGRSGCLTFLAVVLAAVFIPSALIALVLVNAERSFLEPGLYKDAMVEQDIYERVPGLAAEQLVYSGTARPTGEESEDGATSDQSLIAATIDLASPELTDCLQAGLGPTVYAELAADLRPPDQAELGQVKSCLRTYGVPAGLADTHDGMPIYFWILTAEDWRTVLEVLLPPEWLQAQFESVIDQVHDALASNEESTVNLSMADLKARITGDEGFDAVVALIEAQPPCNDDQLSQIQALADPTAPLKDVPICRPPDAVLQAMYPNVRASLVFLAAQIPDQAELKFGGQSGSEDPLARPRQVFGVVRTASYLSLLVPILMLGLIALLVVRSPKSLLRWWGVPLAITGVLAAAIAMAGLSAAHGPMADLLAGSRSSFTALAPGVLDAEEDLLNAIADGFLSAILVQGILLAAVGAAMVASSFFLGRSAVAPAPPQPAPPPPESAPPPAA